MEKVKILLERGAHIEAKYNKGETSLMYAAGRCSDDSFEILKLLTEKEEI